LALRLIAIEEELNAGNTAFEGGEVKCYIFAKRTPFFESFLSFRFWACVRVGIGFVGGRREWKGGIGDDQRVWVEETFGDALEGFLFDVEKTRLVEGVCDSGNVSPERWLVWGWDEN
jgi:hypothetical protein